ncbi:hypothetical protein C8F04DRAFT_958209 [Mycena alexandri]|uniref:Nephrocystin 3-like N-terminal domain-containing protein n=1 Tax=Mycena alexandri TaxID=1745969 RepID=A0AAD6SS41_9AGAR|nr:hypothetical protein C8F04DRAFT_958209 [Mycena alexandri]
MGHSYTEPRTDTAHHNPVHTPNLLHGYPHLNFLPPILGGAQITAENVNYHRPGETGIDILHRCVALEALCDSADSFPQPRCHPETRRIMLDKLYNWSRFNRACGIFFFHRIIPRAPNLLAIMQTLSRRLQDAGHLGGAFLFKRHHSTRGNTKVLFATLAYQLAGNHGPFRPVILQAVERYPSIVHRDIEVQLKHLIIEPRRTLLDAPPPILLVDGLDECQDEKTQEQIIRLRGYAARQCSSRFRFLVASRPEPHIRDILGDSSLDGLNNALNIKQSFNDVRTYLKDEFSCIHHEHSRTMKKVASPWPTPEILNDLVERSSGYFIFASTIIKFIDDKYFCPTERLETIQNLNPVDSGGPFAVLDQLYHQIMTTVRPHPRLLDIILQCVVYSCGLNSLDIDRILGLQTGDTQLILRGVHSMIKVPPDDEKWSSITFHHEYT